MPLRGTAGTGFAESHRSATVLHPVAASAWSPNPGGNTPGVKPDENSAPLSHREARTWGTRH
jgi:hypothetical protein